jgi:hypothetical protein
MMTNNTRDTRIQQIIDYIDSVDDYYRCLLDYASISHRSVYANPDRKRFPLEHAGGGRVLRVR